MQNSHLRVAWWLHARFPKWDPSVDTLQINSPNQFDILLFLDEHFPNIYDTQDSDQPILALTTEPNDGHALTWMREKHNIMIDVHDTPMTFPTGVTPDTGACGLVMTNCYMAFIPVFAIISLQRTCYLYRLSPVRATDVLQYLITDRVVDVEALMAVLKVYAEQFTKIQ
ncbi:hypothetical protein PHYPSEUDO_001650 [Phytophthora pseudosyringae]|uniref:Uncharacterized protein n=1 Tax=Phytophthora pseudosyringae TaxID=221518 RepID=A0A8T1V339_9STRA|nr:hypothetical protein PHYPSEUDO_001650 [Phytophthora pseudosyringae]